MSIKEKINSDYIKALKEKNVIEKTLLGTIKGELQTLEKNGTNVDDAATLSVLTKFTKSVKQMVEYGNSDAITELEILERYTPKQMAEEEITVLIKTTIENGATNIGEIMKVFSDKNADKKLVSTIAKTMLN
jgi:uncharacterized protein YqeY